MKQTDVEGITHRRSRDIKLLQKFKKVEATYLVFKCTASALSKGGKVMWKNYIDESCPEAYRCLCAYPNNDGGMWCRGECENRLFKLRETAIDELIGKWIKVAHSECESLTRA